MSYPVCLLKIIKINPHIKNLFDLDNEYNYENDKNKIIIMNEINSWIFAHKKNIKIKRFKSKSMIKDFIWYSLKINNNNIIILLFKNNNLNIDMDELNTNISKIFSTSIDIQDYNPSLIHSTLKKIFKKFKIILPLELNIISEKTEKTLSPSKIIVINQKSSSLFFLSTIVLCFILVIILHIWIYRVITNK